MPTTSSEVSGVLSTESTAGGSGSPLAGFHVSVRSPDSLFSFNGLELASTSTDASGRFDISYFPDPSALTGPRSLQLVVRDRIGRQLAFAPVASGASYQVRDDGTAVFVDGAGAPNALGTMIIRHADAVGFDVTLGTGVVSAKSSGNAVTLLTDHDAFTHAAALFRSARQEILVSQLDFEVAKPFNADPELEDPTLVFDFDASGGAPEPDLDNPRAIGPSDGRPERLLLDAAARGVETRIALNDYFLPDFLNSIAGWVLLHRGADGTRNTAFDNKVNDVIRATSYFAAAQQPEVKIRAFKQPALTSGVLHAKNVLVDRTHFLSIGSPFKQSYNDSHDHRIDSWMRGDSEDTPRHDSGFAASGPVATDALATLQMIWNAAAPDDPLPATMPTPPADAPGPPALSTVPDGLATVQIARTVSANRISGKPNGEKGILEGYLRAFANAKEFIYIENQYFTNDAIADGLAAALMANPSLQLIALFNIKPDTFTYPTKQRRLITRIRRAIGQTANSSRFSVFTRWSHDFSDGLPRMAPLYLHTKLAIVDNTWAAVGSANLDGFSLDSCFPADVLNTGIFDGTEDRAVEVDGLFTEESGGNTIDVFRRKLWAEHFEQLDAQGNPNLDATAVQLANKPAGGWAQTWRDTANATLQRLKDSPLEPLTGFAPILPWPEKNKTLSEPREHLAAVGLDVKLFTAVTSTRAFDFKTGTWKAGSKADVDVGS